MQWGALFGICYTKPMEINFEKSHTAIKGLPHFCPQQIFDNGQAFRFLPTADGVYQGVAFGKLLRVAKQEDGTIVLNASQQDFQQIWYNYFDLGRDYATLFSDCKDVALKEGRQYAQGLRVLRQQPFETLISFIISANNNLKRIRGIVERICEAYGTPFLYEGKTYHAFPTPAQLAAATETQLKECGSGYRAPYILGSAQKVADGFALEKLFDLPYKEAKAQLVQLPGVGPKVADCVLLFSYAKTEAFPADVWIKRVLRVLYNFQGNEKETCAFAIEKFGECAGIAQQYLFYYARENKLG